VVTRRMQLDLTEENPTLKFEWAADDPEAMSDFKHGIRLLRDKSYSRALAYFRRAHELERNNPYFLSYLGLTTALAERNWADGERLCETALGMKRNQAQLYLNLAEVCLMANKKSGAVDALEIGLQHAPSDARLRRMLETLGIRRDAVFSSLDRRHPLNRTLGKIRYGFRKLLRPRH